jgi:hypothetical protein
MIVIHRIPDTELNATPGKLQVFFLRTFSQLVTKFPDNVTQTVIGFVFYIKCSDDSQLKFMVWTKGWQKLIYIQQKDSICKIFFQ